MKIYGSIQSEIHIRGIKVIKENEDVPKLGNFTYSSKCSGLHGFYAHIIPQT